MIPLVRQSEAVRTARQELTRSVRELRNKLVSAKYNVATLQARASRDQRRIAKLEGDLQSPPKPPQIPQASMDVSPSTTCVSMPHADQSSSVASDDTSGNDADEVSSVSSPPSRL